MTLEKIIDNEDNPKTCVWFKSYIDALNKPKAYIFTSGYVKAGCPSCYGESTEKSCYRVNNDKD